MDCAKGVARLGSRTRTNAVRWSIVIGIVACSCGVPVRALDADADLETVARSRPCLATALVFVRTSPPESGTGVIRLDGVPTYGTFMTLMGVGDSSANAPFVSQESPYATRSYYVEVHWKVTVWGRDKYFFTSRAEIVDGAGVPLSPQHVVEPLTTVVVTKSAVELVSNPSTL